MTRWRLLTFVAIWAAVSAMLLAASADPALMVVGAIIASSSACVYVVIDSGWLTEQRVWSARRGSTAGSPDDGRGATLRRQLRATVHTDSTVVQSQLIELVDDALRDRHHVDRRSTPAAADARLTPSLRRLVADPGRRLGSIHQLHQIVDDIEAL